VAKAIPGLPSEWQNFLFCFALHVTLPLLPLGIEFWFSGRVDEKSAVLTAAMYSIAIGLSSRNLALFGLGLIQGVIFSAAFGFLSKTPHLQSADIGAYCAIGFIMTVHVIERYNRHVIDQAPFLEFQELNAKLAPSIKPETN
jgi:F0F1-type ATP synthase membrane subunit c/vacuolar-type H+-ATPase subunit K